MDIPWYKNYWYIICAFVALGIFVLVYYVTENIKIAVLSIGGEFNYAIEFSLRVLFNPIWILFLWCFERGLKLNSKHHDDILKHIKGVINLAMDNKQKTVLTSTLAKALLDLKSIEKGMKKSLDCGVNMKNSGGDPRIKPNKKI